VFIFFDGNRDEMINIRPFISEIDINVLNYYFGIMRHVLMLSNANNYFSDEIEL